MSPNINRSSFSYHIFSLFSEVKYKVLEKINLEMGLNNSWYKESAVQVVIDPRLKLIYERSSKKIWLDYARTHQYEKNLQMFTISSPVDLLIPVEGKPPYSDQISSGFSLDFENYLSFSGALFYKRLSHIKDFEKVDMTNIMGNNINMLSGQGRSKGAEWGIEYRIASAVFRANYTLSEVKHRFDEINEGQSFSPPYDIRHDFFANLSFDINSSLKLTSSWEYKSGMVVTFPIGVAVAKDLFNDDHALTMIPVYKERYNYRLKPTHRLDVTLAWEKQMISNSIKLDIGVYNAYNRANASFVYIEPVSKDDYYIRFEPRSKVLLPLMPFFSVTYCIN